jgi:uncharacterized RDD family membrane protein YckC
MSDVRPRAGIAFDVKPHAYDPVTTPEYFDGVLPRRIVAFFIDALILSLPVVALSIFIFLFGLVTFGLGWLLYLPMFWALPIAAVIWALLYYGLCFGSEASATLGMRAMDLQMRTWYGAPAYFILGVCHAVLYWVSVSFLTPFVLLITLLNSRRRALHDIILGTIVVNSEERAQTLRGMGMPLDRRPL